ncbi:creatinine amidohydrolase [Kribbella sp. VKM Ac-2527]|uniref:Creatinine amidohydrolase n=1 Tax=Kribbella caucasensis TaxID=2512215 RepID=A0A4R6KMY0_9ACTN|nr:mycofactocin biosynthesis peptidyl-dipeptidase MftE [Kribbella sp. VKM Ac-2527]TDO51775.1 creatinine amidohydrolase [Kribbella sp. VKM Ac-2527]
MSVLAAATWTEVGYRPLVLVPVGSIEQHGPHLPLDTDAVIAAAVARRVAELMNDEVFVAPVMAYTASGEHQDFPGTSSIGAESLSQVIIELVRSMRTWADRIVIVNAHGGNTCALARAVGQLLQEEHDVGWAACATEGIDAHAGYTETSLMLHLQPWAVRRHRAEAGNTTPISELLPALVRDGVRAVAPNGVLGDPTGANANEGARCLETMARDIAAVVRGRPDSRGFLHRTAAADVVG